MYLKRPEVFNFDPSNKLHRQAVRDFMKRNAWSDTTMRFTHDPAHGSVAEQVQSKLLAWYMEKDTPKTVATKVLKSS